MATIAKKRNVFKTHMLKHHLICQDSGYPNAETSSHVPQDSGERSRALLFENPVDPGQLASDESV